MRLPHPLIQNTGFLVESPEQLVMLLGNECKPEEASHIKTYYNSGLPPVTSINSLSVMLGYNPGFIWSILHNPSKHYREFTIPKGKSSRNITAPRIGLKLIQKWLSIHLTNKSDVSEHVFGFVPGRSHIQAAMQHLGAKWVVSVDIANFFPSICSGKVSKSIHEIGYRDKSSIDLLTSLTCFRDRLTQGSPSSPVLSNMVLRNLDKKLSVIAKEMGIIFTRYADDIVLSGTDNDPKQVLEIIRSQIELDGWKVSERKLLVQSIPRRLKVHGLLVHGNELRLTKGYRNRLRAYSHLLQHGKLKESNLPKIIGHLQYARSVRNAAKKIC